MTKSVVVTGGNRGIGRAITSSFLDAGYHVIVGARKSQDVESLNPERVTFVEMDVRNEEDHLKLADAAIKATGALDVYVNNAGFSEWRPIEKIDDIFFDKVINTNLKGAFWGCKAAAARMQGSQNTIINISSIAGKRGSTNNAMYCASKFGMNGLTQSLSKELGVNGIRVNALCPVLIKTDGLMDALASDYAPAAGDPEAFLVNFNRANSALGVLPTGNDVGKMCVFLSSDQAGAITGQCINVDCGVFPQ